MFGALLVVAKHVGVSSTLIVLLIVLDTYLAYVADLARVLLQSLRRTMLLGTYTLMWIARPHHAAPFVLNRPRIRPLVSARRDSARKVLRNAAPRIWGVPMKESPPSRRPQDGGLSGML
jgi:hypothetical protein